MKKSLAYLCMTVMRTLVTTPAARAVFGMGGVALPHPLAAYFNPAFSAYSFLASRYRFSDVRRKLKWKRPLMSSRFCPLRISHNRLQYLKMRA